ncbi:ATP synthase subunit g [bacterium]|nr:ATP synthase subunit g [bacterium]
MDGHQIDPSRQPQITVTICALLTSPLPLPSPSQVGTAALFTTEVYAWFCVGEIVGRGGGLTGY